MGAGEAIATPPVGSLNAPRLFRQNGGWVCHINIRLLCLHLVSASVSGLVVLAFLVRLSLCGVLSFLSRFFGFPCRFSWLCPFFGGGRPVRPVQLGILARFDHAQVELLSPNVFA